MKNFFLLIFIFFVSTVNCKSDDDSSIVTIEGTWNIEKYEFYYSEDNISDVEINSCVQKGFMNFEKNSYKYKGYGLEDDLCVDFGTSEGSYTLTENKLIFKDLENDSEIIYNVIKLTSNELVFSFENDDFDGDGINDKLTYYLKK